MRLVALWVALAASLLAQPAPPKKSALDKATLEDYRSSFRRLAPLSDLMVVNVSSPNTPGLRELQRRESLHALLLSLLGTREESGRRVPLLVKIAPDLAPEER